MKTSLRKLVAMICVLAIAAVLPVMASAEGTSLTIAADKTNVKAGDEVTISFVSAGLSEDVYWNLLEFAIEYDATQVEHVMQGSGRDALEYIPGSALYKSATVEVNGAVNPLLGAAIDASENQYDNGTIMSIVFKVKDGVADGDKIAIDVNLKAFGQSIIENGQSKGTEPLEDAGITTIELTVGNATPSSSATSATSATASSATQSTATSATESSATSATESSATSATESSATEAPATTVTKADDVTTATEADDVTTTTEADVTTTTEADTDDVVTGETTTMIVLALVLMAGSAVALISMKKKALSK